MAEGSGNRYPGQAPGYYNRGYPMPSSGQPPVPMQMFPPTTTIADMFMSQFARDMQYSQYQNNQYPGPGAQFPGHNNAQFHRHSAPYPIHGSSFPDNPSMQNTRHYEPGAQYFGSNQYPGNVPFQDRTNMQNQAKYVMPTSPVASMSFDNSYSKPNANFTSPQQQQQSPEQYNESKGGQSHSRFSGRPGQGTNINMNYNKFSETDSTMAQGSNSGTKDSQYIRKREDSEMSHEAPAPTQNSPALRNASAVSGTVNRTPSESGVFGSQSDSGGARSKAIVRGRGGRGRRGSRRGGFGSERLNQQNPGGYSWYDSQENRADEQKRERDSALAETAAFMKNLNIRRDDSSPQHENTGDRRGRGGHGRYERGGGGGTRYQRDYYNDDKQGKDWVNRQVRTEGEKNSYEMQNNYSKFNNNQRRMRQNGTSPSSEEWKSQYGKDTTGAGEGSDNNQNLDLPGGEDERTSSAKLGGNVRFNRGRSRGRQDRRFWDGRHTGSSPPSNDTNSKNSPSSQGNRPREVNNVVSSHASAAEGKEDEESQRVRLSEQLTKGTYECMVCCDAIKQQHAIWSCLACYNCFHLGCIKKWAKSSTGGMSSDHLCILLCPYTSFLPFAYCFLWSCP